MGVVNVNISVFKSNAGDNNVLEQQTDAKIPLPMGEENPFGIEPPEEPEPGVWEIKFWEKLIEYLEEEYKLDMHESRPRSPSQNSRYNSFTRA